MRRFINRERELAALEQRWEGARAELLVLYGRRRVGKSALLRHFCQGRPHAYFLATRVRTHDSLEAFRGVLREATGNSLLDRVRIDSWEAALELAAELLAGNGRAGVRSCLILDEFQYLCEAAPELPSILQKWWDTVGRETRLMVVLCGSHISFMEAEVLAERSPLFGRRTGQLRLHPLEPWHAGQFFPRWPAPEQLKAFSILGGIPAYLERFDAGLDLRTNALREILSPDGYLYDEMNFLLRTELGQAHIYLSLLKAIAGGATRLSEIASRSALPVTSLARPLGVLADLGFIQREVPFTEENPHKSKRGIYVIVDPFTRFWCRYVLPHLSLIGAGSGELVWERFIEPDLPTWLGSVFEEVCRRFVLLRSSELVPGEQAVRVGRIWERELELDIVAELTDGSWLVGECKAWSGRVGVNILETLKSRARSVRPPSGRRRLALFSTGGFTDELEAVAGREGVLLVGLEQVVGTPPSSRAA